MAIERQAERAVVGQRVLNFARRLKHRGSLVHPCGRQHLGRTRVDARHRPCRLVAVAREPLQRIGLGDHAQLVSIQAGSAGHVFDGGEGRFVARIDDEVFRDMSRETVPDGEVMNASRSPA